LICMAVAITEQSCCSGKHQDHHTGDAWCGLRNGSTYDMYCTTYTDAYIT
jgi:hypothetical protein